MEHRPPTKTMPLIQVRSRALSDPGFDIDWEDTREVPVSESYERPQRMRGWEADD